MPQQLPKKSSSARTQTEAARQLRPDTIPADPPDVAPAASILQNTAPTFDDVKELTLDDVRQILDVVDITILEKRITLLSRLVIEAALWKSDGMSKKERADLALKAIATLEGSKNQVWVRDEDDIKPKSQEELEEEIAVHSAKLQKILAEQEKADAKKRKKATEHAVAVMTAQHSPKVGEA